MMSILAVCLIALTASVAAQGLGHGVMLNAPRHAAGRNYAFDYSVSDPHTGDNKGQWERRDGGVVRGAYFLQEPDGTMRIIEYQADDATGFNYVLRRVGPIVHPITATGHGIVPQIPMATHPVPRIPVTSLPMAVRPMPRMPDSPLAVTPLPVSQIPIGPLPMAPQPMTSRPYAPLPMAPLYGALPPLSRPVSQIPIGPLAMTPRPHAPLPIAPLYGALPPRPSSGPL